MTAKTVWLSLVALLVSPLGCAADDGPCDPTAPGTICTVAGNGAIDGKRGSAGDGGDAYDARFDQIMDVAVMPNGELWMIDYNSYLVRAIDQDGIIRTVIGNGLLGDGPPEGQRVPATSVGFNHTTDMIVHDGYLYLAGFHNARVIRVELSTMEAEIYAGAGTRLYYYGDGGLATRAALDLPAAITIDDEGNLFIMDQANQVIRRVDQEGFIDRFAGRCVADYHIECAEGQEPIACPESNKTVCGDLDQCSTECAPAFSGDGGHCLEMRMAQEPGQDALPGGRLVHDTDGRLIFADTGNNRLRRIDVDGIVTTIAGTGEEGAAGDGGPAVDAQLNMPVDVEVGPDGSIYFTDTGNNCIRRIDSTGIITTVAGQCASDGTTRGFAGDGGDPLDAELNLPFGIEIDGDRLYIADTLNHRVRVVNL